MVKIKVKDKLFSVVEMLCKKRDCFVPNNEKKICDNYFKDNCSRKGIGNSLDIPVEIDC
jgi:DNA-directed RNA polymerase specialized sigma subunit